MRFPVKLAIGSFCALMIILLVGFLIFPKLLTSKVKGMVNLAPGNEIREMFIKVPFALSFKVYLFNVTNPMEVQNGDKPVIKEIGPFCYEEWKEKVNVEDSEADDTISYNPKDTFLKKKWPGCKTGQEEITIPHPMILGVVNAVVRQKPGALSLLNKAIKSIYGNPSSIFLTAKADNILFDGVIINCGVTDFAGKAICSQLKGADTMKLINESELSFSLLGPGLYLNKESSNEVSLYKGSYLFFDGESPPRMFYTYSVTPCIGKYRRRPSIFPRLVPEARGWVYHEIRSTKIFPTEKFLSHWWFELRNPLSGAELKRPFLERALKFYAFHGICQKMNATVQKRIKARRGRKNYRDVGRIVEYNDAKSMDVWTTDECNKIEGTDGTIFPPLMGFEDGLNSFSPSLCRSLLAYFVKKTKYDGIPCGEYTADLGDMTNNENEKCYCTTPDTCLKKGLMDLYKCSGAPIYASLPHFYNCDESYREGVKGLSPNKTKHEIRILFETTTGSPLSAKKRLQFNMPLEPNQKIDLFKNFTATVLPIFWIEEGVDLNRTYTAQLKSLFTLKKVVKVGKWLILVASLGGLAASGYLFFKNNGAADITPVHDIQRNGNKSGISMVNHPGERDNQAVSNIGMDKF